MDAAEFCRARELACIVVPDIWERAVGVTPDQNKSYASGRTPVPADVAFRVGRLLNSLDGAARELRATLESALPTCTVELDAGTRQIRITFPSGKITSLQCKGVDLMNGWPTYAGGPRDGQLFVYAPESPWSRSLESQPSTWRLWRGSFLENRNLGRFQNYPNVINEGLLLEAFAQ